MVFVRKKDGTVRPCVDYRKLNEVTRKDAYPLPRIDDCLDSMSGAKLFSTIDLQSGYWQIGVRECDRPKTAVVTRSGLYEYQTMPFGLCNAPGTFQRCMELVLRGLQWKTLLVYIDDVIVFSTSFEKHVEDLEEVLNRLAAAGLKLKPSKCEFFKSEVSFLGHVVTPEGIRTDPRKIEVVQEWAVPRNVTDVRSFLGFCSYYRRFIRNFADIAGPLHRLLEAERVFEWDSECQNAFETLKLRLVGDTVMSYPNNTDIFILDTDASDRAIGSTLAQMQWNEERQCKEERPIAYASKSLSKTQRSYCTTRRELLAVVVFVNYFRHYLLGRKFIVRTDHSALRWLMSFKEPTDQTARWLELLSQFNFEIEHRAGKKHANADALSRLPCDPDDCECYDGVTVLTELPCGGCEKCLKKHQSWSEFAKVDDVVPLTFKVKQTDVIRKEPESGHFTLYVMLVISHILTVYRCVCYSLKFIKDRVQQRVGPQSTLAWWRNSLSGGSTFLRAVRTARKSSKPKHGRATDNNDETVDAAHHTYLSSFSALDIKKAQAVDTDLKFVLDWFSASKIRPKRDEIKIDSFSPTVRNLWLLWDQLYVKESILYKRWKAPNKNNCYSQLVVPRSMRDSVLRMAHNVISSAHLGVNKTLKKTKRDYYWYGMKEDVRNWIRKCDVCGARKRPPKSPRAPLKVYNVGLPMDRVAMDILAPFPQSSKGNKYILVVGDIFTRWIEAYPIPDQTSSVIAHTLVYEFFSRFGLPLTLHSDQGRYFESTLMADVCSLLEIKKTRSSPYHPASNGIIERFNQTLVNMISSYVDEKQEDWDVHLPLLTAAYRTCEHTATGYSPNALMLGRETHTPLTLLLGSNADNGPDVSSYGDYACELKENLSLMYDLVRENLGKTGNRQKRNYDVKVAYNNYKVGDLVYFRDDTKTRGLSPKLKRRKWIGPCVITKKYSDLLFEIKPSRKKKSKTLHHDRLKPYLSDTVPDDSLQLQHQLLDHQDEAGVYSSDGACETQKEVRRSTRVRKPPDKLLL